MRPGNKQAHFIYKDSEIIGLTLYPDFTSEHEQGIKNILNKLKINDNALGIDKRIINIPLEFKQTENAFYLTTSEYDIRQYIKPGRTDGCWDEDDFLFYTSEDTKQFNKFKESLLKDTYIITKGSSLTIQRLNTVPKETKQRLLDSDKLNNLTKSLAKKEGITELIDSYRTKWKEMYKTTHSPWDYMCITPRLEQSTRTLSYWLNPSHQDLNRYGWFNSKDFKLWLRGEGSIPKSINHYKYLTLITKIEDNYCMYKHNVEHYNLYKDSTSWAESDPDIYNAVVKKKLDSKAIKAIESRVKPYCRELYNHYTSFTNNEESFVELNKYMDNYNKSELQRRQIHSALTSYADAGLLYKNGACNTPAKRENKNWWADVLDNEIKYEFILNSGVYNEEEVKF